MHKKAKEKSFNLDFFEKRRPYRTLFLLADGERFELPEGRPSTVFKTAALNRSATHPQNHLEVLKSVLRKPLFWTMSKNGVV